MNLDYSRVEVAADARHKVCSCGTPPQMPCNEADAVRSIRLEGKLCRYKMKKTGKKTLLPAKGIRYITGRNKRKLVMVSA